MLGLKCRHWLLNTTRFFSGAGIDESNSNGYYTLLPDKPFDEAERIWEFLREKHVIQNLGVIVTDSHSQPLRSGAVGISLACGGFIRLKAILAKMTCLEGLYNGRPPILSIVWLLVVGR